MLVRPTSIGIGARRRPRRGCFLLCALLVAALALPSAAAAADETFVVDSYLDAGDDDPGDRVCQTVPGGPCTLRAAAMEASSGFYSATELLAIELGPGEYRLTGGDSLNFTANAQVVVTGAGATRTTIRQTRPTRAVLHTGGSELHLVDLTIRGGDVRADDDGSLNGNGAGLYAIGDLIMDGVLLHQNRGTPASGDPSGTAAGGGAYIAGAFSISRTSFVGNEAHSAGGVTIVGSSGGQIGNALIADNVAARNGGVEMQGSATITGSAIRDNVATDPLEGGAGGIDLGRFGIQAIQRSEISGNRGRAGGITVGGAAVLENLTISGNEATEDGDGPAITLTNPFDGSLEMEHLTIADNTAPSGGAATAIHAVSTSAVAANPPEVRHSILDGSCSVPVTGGDQNVESGTSCLPAPLSGGDLRDTDPELGPLAANGGPTRTQMPAATSPALDIALGDIVFFDQRRFTRPGAADDAGAVEREGASVGEIVGPPGTIVPDTAIDSGPAGTIAVAAASFSFHGEPATETTGFECRIDGGAFAECGSPTTFSGLSNGSHSVEFRALNAIGKPDPTPASRGFTVAVPTGDAAGPPASPDGRVSAPRVHLAKRILVRGRELVAKVRVGAAERTANVSTATLIVTTRKKGKRKIRRTKLRPVRASTRPGAHALLRHRYRGGKKKRQRLTRQLRRQLLKGRAKAKLRIRVTLTDEAGNSVTKKRVARVAVRRPRRAGS